MKYTKINSEIIDRWIDEGWEWGQPITEQKFLRAKNGEIEVLLTASKFVPREWFKPFLTKDLNSVKILGLAAGGAQQMPIFAANNALVTVLDYSSKQIDSEISFAKNHGYKIDAVCADMTNKFPFENESFDIVFNPISLCYIEDIMHVWRECYRVLKKNGILMVGIDNGINYLIDEEIEPLVFTNKLPFNPLKDKALYEKMMATDSGIQFSHSLTDIIDGQIRTGFTITNLYEDSFKDSVVAKYTEQYLAIRSIKN